MSWSINRHAVDTLRRAKRISGEGTPFTSCERRLPSVVREVGGKMTVIVDSGFRRGSDILKGLALGADAVIVGRATLYGVSAAGEPGATRALEILHSEIRRTMGVMGLTDLRQITRDHVVLPHELPL